MAGRKLNREKSTDDREKRVRKYAVELVGLLEPMKQLKMERHVGMARNRGDIKTQTKLSPDSNGQVRQTEWPQHKL